MGRTKSGDPLVMTALDPVTFAKAVADQVVERLRKEGAASKSDSAAASTAALAKRVRPGDWWCLRWVCPAGDSQWRHCGREGRQPLPLSELDKYSTSRSLARPSEGPSEGEAS